MCKYLTGKTPVSALLLVTAFALAACSTTGQPAATLNVYAAASLGDAFGEIAAAFEAQQPQVAVLLNLAGTQILRAQIEQGAPADVFASANPLQMQLLAQAGLVPAAAVTPFASNQLVVIVPAANPAAIVSLADLARPGIKLVLAAPEAPAGAYSLTALENLSQDPSLGPDYAARVLANLVSEERNVRQAATKIQLAEADASIVYTSDLTPELAAAVHSLAIPPEYNVVARYVIAPLQQTPAAQAFVAFVRSPEGQVILRRWGFGAPPE